MRKPARHSKKKYLLIAASVGLCAVLAAVGLRLYAKSQIAKIPELTFAEALEYTTHGDPGAVITVGIIRDGQASYTVYGEDASELSPAVHTYEIGSLTKTFTAALIERAAGEGRLDLKETIDRYLDLPAGRAYPTIGRLLTHTSGYRGWYFETEMIGNFLKGRNDYFGISGEKTLRRAAGLNVGPDGSAFKYSNFGYAVLGLVLEKAYGSDYASLVNDFAQNTLGLPDTRVSDGTGDLGRLWDWNAGDAYIAAGGLTSNIVDMLAYAGLQLDEGTRFPACHARLETIDASSADYRMMGINMDGIGMAWIIDDENGIIWHNGGTGHYNCYLGFRPETGTAAVVLSNLSPGSRIPATVLGVKLLRELDGLE